MLGHPQLVGSFEEHHSLFGGHVILLLSHRVLNDFQRRSVHLFRQHLVGTLEGIDGVDEVDAQLVDVYHAVGEFYEPVALRFFSLVGCRSVEVNRIALVVNNLVALYHDVEQQALAHHLRLVFIKFGIFLANHLRNQNFCNRLRCGASAYCPHHHIVLQHACFQVVELLLHNELCLCARQRFQALYHQRTCVQRTGFIIINILHRLEMPAWSHHLFHKQRGGNGLQEIVHSHLHVGLLSIGHSNHIHKLSRRLALTVSGTTSYNLHHLCQRATHANGEAFLTPLPVESLFCRAKGNDDVHVVAALHPLQISLHKVARLGMVLHKVGHLKQSAVLGSYIIYAAIVVVAALHLAYCLYYLVGLGVFAQSARGTRVYARYVYDGLLACVEHLGYVVEIAAMIEMVAQHKVL